MKYKFWVKSSRMTTKEEIVELGDWIEGEDDREELVKDELISWCNRVFPLFEFTDSYVTYGFEEMEFEEMEFEEMEEVAEGIEDGQGGNSTRHRLS